MGAEFTAADEALIRAAYAVVSAKNRLYWGTSMAPEMRPEAEMALRKAIDDLKAEVSK